MNNLPVAQLDEHRNSTPDDAGSSPAGEANHAVERLPLGKPDSPREQGPTQSDCPETDALHADSEILGAPQKAC